MQSMLVLVLDKFRIWLSKEPDTVIGVARRVAVIALICYHASLLPNYAKRKGWKGLLPTSITIEYPRIHQVNRS
jgi:hypothetical protein